MDIQTVTAIAAFVYFAIIIIEIPLWFIYSGPPPAKNVLARTFISIFLFPVWIVFLAGLRQLVAMADANLLWLVDVSLLAAIVAIAVTLVAHSMQVGAILGKTKRIDPTTIGSGGEGSLLIYGPINSLLMATFIAAGTIALIGSSLAPSWLGIVGGLVVLLQVTLVPTIFSRSDPAYFTA